MLLSFESLSVSVDMLMLKTKRVFLGRATCYYNSNGGYGITLLQDIRYRLYNFAANDQMNLDRNIIEIYSKSGQLISERILLTSDCFNDLGINYVLFGKSYDLLPPYLNLGQICKLFYMISNTNDSIIIAISFLLTIVLSTASLNNDSYTDTNLYNEWILLQLVILHVNYVYEICDHDNGCPLHVSLLCLNKFIFFEKFIQSYIQLKGYHDYQNYSPNNMTAMILESIAPLTNNEMKQKIGELLSYMIN